MQVLSKRDVGLVMIGINVPMAIYFVYDVIGQMRAQIAATRAAIATKLLKSQDNNPVFESEPSSHQGRK